VRQALHRRGLDYLRAETHVRTWRDGGRKAAQIVYVPDPAWTARLLSPPIHAR